jgi:hypothetical protein
MWIDFIEEFEGKCEFFAPASIEMIEQVETAMGIRLPDSLRELLLETNGVYSGASYLNIIWNTDEIIHRNISMRNNTDMAELYMTFESLLFFADAGVDGILFAYPISASGIVQHQNIIAWYPMEDSRSVLAFGLKDYLKRWLNGGLSV